MDRPFAEQHAFNRQVWHWRVQASPSTDMTEKVETDRDGNLVIGRPPNKPYPRRASRIAKLLGRFLPAGFWQMDDTVSTPEGG